MQRGSTQLKQQQSVSFTLALAFWEPGVLSAIFSGNKIKSITEQMMATKLKLQDEQSITDSMMVDHMHVLRVFYFKIKIKYSDDKCS